jgi:hypothetical protein
VAPTKERSVFTPGKKPETLKNILKERELEQWVAPAKGKAPQAAPARVAPHPEERLQKIVAPRTPAPQAAPARVAPHPEERLQKTVAPRAPVPQAAPARAVQAPAGKREFKRVPESQGGANVAPAPVIMPAERQKAEKLKELLEEERRRDDEGRGKKK